MSKSVLRNFNEEVYREDMRRERYELGYIVGAWLELKRCVACMIKHGWSFEKISDCLDLTMEEVEELASIEDVKEVVDSMAFSSEYLDSNQDVYNELCKIGFKKFRTEESREWILKRITEEDRKSRNG